MSIGVASPLVELVGVGTVFGNTDAHQGARNALDWRALMGHPDVPVAVGATDPSHGTFKGGPTWIHGEKGTGAIALPESAAGVADVDAPDLLISLANTYPGELEIISIGSLTNLATALERDPELPAKVKKVTAMGGIAGIDVILGGWMADHWGFRSILAFTLAVTVIGLLALGSFVL